MSRTVGLTSVGHTPVARSSVDTPETAETPDIECGPRECENLVPQTVASCAYRAVGLVRTLARRGGVFSIGITGCLVGTLCKLVEPARRLQGGKEAP